MNFWPKHDAAFHALFGDESRTTLLISLINAVLMPEGHPEVIEVVVLQSRMNASYNKQKRPVFDVRAKASDGRLFDIEIQLAAKPGRGNRRIYYWARNVVEQLKEGSHYIELNPTICIFFQDFVEEHLPYFHVIHSGWYKTPQASVPFRECGPEVPCDLEIHLVQLPLLRPFNEENVLSYNALEDWGYFLTLEDDKLREAFSVKNSVMAKAIADWEKLRAKPELQHIQRDIEMARASALIELDAAIKEAQKIAEERGEKRGIEIGESRGIEIGESRGIEIGESRGEERERKIAEENLRANIRKIAMPLAVTITEQQELILQKLNSQQLQLVFEALVEGKNWPDFEL